MTDPGEVKACCAAAYSSDLVSLLLGDSYHPGGQALTRRLAATMDLHSGQTVLDVAFGRGTSALTIAREYDVSVVGVCCSLSATSWAGPCCQSRNGVS
jgi:arsenite methyltransferase